MFDLVISNAKVIDGSGNPWFRADLGIAGDRLVAGGDLAATSAKRRIDAGGLVACPGFIDIHSHSGRSLTVQNKGLASLQQGITTQVVGNCGHSLAPTRNAADSLKGVARDYGLADVDFDWTTFAEYLAWQEKRGTGINMAALVGHGSVRRFVMGPEGEGGEREIPTAAELEGLRAEVAAAMAAGAYGMSAGLEYPPGRNARTEEMVELCRVVAEYDGLFSTHMRSEGQAPRMEWLGAIAETVEIGRLSGVRVDISHLKADQRGAWWKTPAALRMIEDARRHGVQITADVYPWPFAATIYLYEVLPPSLAEDGLAALLAKLKDSSARAAIRDEIERGVPGWTNPANSFGWGAIGIVETSDPAAEGLSIEDVAIARGKDPLEVCFELLLGDGGLTRSSAGVMSDENIQMKLKHPLTMVSTDGLTVDSYPRPAAAGDPPPKVHPRTVATYPRLLGRYVRELGTLTLTEAIRKSTSLPAQATGIVGRGLLVPGYFADVVVFDPATIGETGTFADPHHPPRGVAWVVINGVLAVEDGRPTETIAGRVLQRGAEGAGG